MEKKRIGKDLIFRWPILVDGKVTSLVGMGLKVVLKDALLQDIDLTFYTEGNIVVASFPATLQRVCGAHHLTLWQNFGKEGQLAVDACNAVELVPVTCMEQDVLDGLDNEVIELIEGNLSAMLQGPKGEKGDDGISVTHSWEGSKLTLTSASGTTVTDLKGPKGDRGVSGNLNYPRMRVNEKKHLIISASTSNDRDRFELRKGHLIIKL